jgi:ribonuclease P protein component
MHSFGVCSEAIFYNRLIFFVVKQATLGKNERLKSRKLIEQLFSQGKSLSFPSFRIFYSVKKIYPGKQSEHTLQFGVGVSGKNFKKAVDRNRIKRLIRESYRLQKNELQKILKEKNIQLNVFFIYNSKDLPDFNTVKEKVNVILNKLIHIIHENISANT